MAEPTAWTPSSWRTRPIHQAVTYPPNTIQALGQTRSALRRLPPLVHPREIAALRSHLADVAQGRAFVLQGGDCAELFDYCEQTAIESNIKLLLQMSLVLVWGANVRVVRIGRMAGQYAKPRSSPTEWVAGQEVPSFRGDILNGFALDERELDPARMVKAYHCSAATLNYARAAISCGFADLRRRLDWGLGHVRDEVLREKYGRTVDAITDMLRFLHTIGVGRSQGLDTVDLYTSHEGLLLEYEEGLTRRSEIPSIVHDHGEDRKGGNDTPVEARPEYFDTSAHFLWIGDRTRQLDGAHVEFFSGIANPVGVKVGPTTSAADLLALLRVLNPTAEPGKVTLITRYGAARVHSLLPGHIQVVEGSEFKRAVVWQCDPMHGNTISASGGVKTRRFSDILLELTETLRIHREQGSYLGGVHLELTGDAVTECLGGAEEIDENDLSTNYTSFCDPRLNEKQALELAFVIADHYHRWRHPIFI